jgi:signal transduction histidine kinase
VPFDSDSGPALARLPWRNKRVGFGADQGQYMPDLIRAKGTGVSFGRKRRAMPFGAPLAVLAGSILPTAARAIVALVAVTSLGGQASAQDDDPLFLGVAYVEAIRNLDAHELAGLALFFGVVVFAVVTAVTLVRTRERLRIERERSRAEAAALEGEIDRLVSLLLAEPQVIIAWDRGGKPQVIGDPCAIAPDLTIDRIMTFAAWLRPEQALQLESAVERLLRKGESFSVSLTTAIGRSVAAEGRAISGSAVLKLGEVSGLKKELAEVTHRLGRLQADTEALRALIEALPSPAWTRDAAGELTWVNPAYARAVEASNAASAVRSQSELLDGATRTKIGHHRASLAPFSIRAGVMVAGTPCVFDIFEVSASRGSAGMTRDATATEILRTEIARIVAAHRRTLDRLATGVAIFDADHHLAFYNSAYRSLWDLEAAFLDEGPADSAVLDRLRAERLLPEQPDFRAWKAALHHAYRASEPAEYEWHLPDQRTLRVVTTPNPDGGVTYLFDDVTARLNLERRFDALIRLQGETLDNLTEGVALFGSDGRVRLFNPVFARMWQLSPASLTGHPHIEAVIDSCRVFHHDDTTWTALRAAVTALESRDPFFRRIDRVDGSVVDCHTVRMPDGATLVTFQDVTDSVNVERVLTERNEALVEADRIKIDFVRHVSYELRSPLTNIIGFAQFLGDPTTGALTPRQDEYLGYITASSNALLAIINNILDLASIDAGAMVLQLEPVDIRATMAAAAEGVQDRLVNGNIKLNLNAPADIGSFVADERRVRQILFNLLSNAIGFSPPGETVALTAARTPDEVTFTVTDHGPGISSEIRNKVFDLFESHNQGTSHRGAGLGLSIVRSFVELHHGTVQIESVPGRGTNVICTFPLATVAAQHAAE